MMDLDSLELFPVQELQKCFTPLTTGILPSQNIRELIDRGRISSPVPITEEQIQPSSLDLRLGPKAYRIPASFLSSRSASVSEKLRQMQPYEVDLTHPVV